MEDLKIGDIVYIQSYKHDGSLHRTWCKGLLIDKKEDAWVVVTDHSYVIESDGRRWITKEPAICYLYDDHWYNIISMVRRTGIYYYCNMASPSLYDGEAIKNIDYDLDVKVFPDGSYVILDEDEYADHSKKMHYPKEIEEILKVELEGLIKKIKTGCLPFDSDHINDELLSYLNGSYGGKDGTYHKK